MSTRQTFAKFRAGFWVLTAGIIGLYLFGLMLGVYGPLELGLLSFLCLALLTLFTVHEVLMRRERRAHPEEVDHSDRERRGF